MIRQITETCWAIGKVVRKPTIEISFLSYLLCGPRNILIDTIPPKAASVWYEELSSLLNGRPVDALILNHSEEDHSGGLSLLLEDNPGLPILCTSNCRNRLVSAFPKANYLCVEHDSQIALGTFTFRFLHTPGLHWNDNMVTFWEQEQMLFSNDLFGQYLGLDTLTDDTLSSNRILTAAKNYFDKVFSTASLKELTVLDQIRKLATHQIAPGHGVLLNQANSKLVLESYCDKLSGVPPTPTGPGCCR